MKKLVTVAFMTTLFAYCGERRMLEANQTVLALQDRSGTRNEIRGRTTFQEVDGGFGLAPVAAQAAPELRIRMLLTALALDRSLNRRTGDSVHIATVGECPTAHTLHQMQGKGPHGMPIRIHTAPPMATASRLGQWVRERRIKVLYLCSMPREAHILAGILEANSVTVLADNPAWVGTFASLGVIEKDGRSRLLVNIKNARAAGMILDSSVYASAIVIAD